MRSFRLISSTTLGQLTLAGALALAPVAPAMAAPPEEGEEAAPEGSPDDLSEKAVEAFEAKDYETAVKYFEAAYDADPNPNYLFNIGRVFEEMGDLRNAVDRYEKFVKSPGVDLDSRKFANERLEVLRGIISAEDEAKAKEEQRKADAEEAERRRKSGAGEGQDPTGGAEGGEPKDDPRKRTRTVGYVLLGVGAAAAAGGGVAGGLALGKHNDFKDETDPMAAADLKTEGQRLNAAADGLYITGGAIALTGLIMVVATLGKKKSKSDKTSRTQFQPAFGRTGAGLSLTHRF